MSSTVRQVINDRLSDRKQFQLSGGFTKSGTGRFDAEQCSGQRKLFDLRRHLMMSDDSYRLHLEEISGMLSPKQAPISDKPGLLPVIEPFSIARST